MGGSVALMVTLEQRIKIEHCIMDGGIKPYQLPWLMTRFIALKDYLMIMLGRAGGISLLEKAFATDEYTKEDLQYVVDVLPHSCSPFRLLGVLFLLLYVSYRGKIKKRLKQIVISKNEKKDSSTRK